MKLAYTTYGIVSLFLLSAVASSVAQARDFKNRDEIERALSSPISLAKAVTIATNQVKGRPISAEIEDYTPLVAEIKIAVPDGAHKLIVDLQKGTVVNNSEPLLASKAFKYSRKHTALDNAKVSLLEAIEIAEHKTGGKVVKIKFASEGGQYVYDVETVEKNSYSDLRIDANSKELLQSDYRRIK